MTTTTELPEALRDATENQPSARAALAAALASPVHAYLFAGPPGAGKGRAARAFAAELLADGALDPDDARRRALADPSHTGYLASYQDSRFIPPERRPAP